MTTTYADLVREVRSALRGYNLVREQVSFLNGSITNSALTFTVDDGTLIQPGVVEIEDECIWVQSITGNVATVSPDGRGWDGTTAASHADNKRVTVNPPYPTWRLARAINDTIVGTSPTLWGVASTSFTYNPSVSTYSLPATATEVLSVTTTVLGPSQDQVEIHDYRFNANAPTAEFATGKCITLAVVPDPGQTVTVTYQKAPSEITSADSLTTSGLRETARALVVYGAVGRMLAFIDSSRAAVGSAVGSEFADTNRVGTATQLAGQLTARYQMELAEEQKRLRQANPARVRRIGR